MNYFNIGAFNPFAGYFASPIRSQEPEVPEEQKNVESRTSDAQPRASFIHNYAAARLAKIKEHANLYSDSVSLNTPLKSGKSYIVDRAFWQNPHETIEETIRALKETEVHLNEIYLCTPTNELLAVILERFPDLESLSLNSDPAPFSWDKFDFLGLPYICNLKKLKRLDFKSLTSCWTDSLEELFKMPHLKENLESLYYMTAGVFYEGEARALADYKQLKSLAIQGQTWSEKEKFSTEGVIKLLKSPTLQASLTSLCLQYTDVNDYTTGEEFIDALCELQSLTSLIFTPFLKIGSEIGQFDCSPSKISCLSVKRFLDATPNLKELFLSSIAVDFSVMEKLSEMPYLESLHLFDCTEVTARGFEVFCEGKAPLKKLTLVKPDNMSKVSLLKKFEQLEELSLFGLGVSSEFIEFCQSVQAQQNLRLLTLIECPFDTDAFISIGQLEALEVLRIDDCINFNDDSLASAPKSLKKILLDGVSIAGDTSCVLGEMSSLKSVLIGRCPALTKRSIKQILANPHLQESLETFALDLSPLPLKDVPMLSNFVALKAMVYNCDNLGREKVKEFYKIAKEKNWEVVFGFERMIDNYNQMQTELPYIFSKV